MKKPGLRAFKDLLVDDSESRSDWAAANRKRRADRRAGLQVGHPFRPYDLFDNVSVLPNVLREYPGLTAGEKLAWLTLSSFKGKEGLCFPSWETLGRAMGVDRTQAKRWVTGLVKKGFVTCTNRLTADRRWRSNVFELIWHAAFATSGNHGQNSPDGLQHVHDLCIPGGGDLSMDNVRTSHPEKIHHQREISNKRRHLESSTPSFSDGSNLLDSKYRIDGGHDYHEEDHSIDPLWELGRRLVVRHGQAAEPLLCLIIELLPSGPESLQEFLDLDAATTKHPELLRNPGGYYRNLVRDFHLMNARRRRGSASLLGPHPTQIPLTRPSCELQKCDGSGEILTPDGVYACECRAGQLLSPAVMELLQRLNDRLGRDRSLSDDRSDSTHGSADE